MYNLGIDLGGTNIAAGIVDQNNKIIAKDRTPTGAERAGEAIISDMARLISSLLSKANLKTSDISSVGIASPGIANKKTGNIEYANNLPFLNFPISDMLKSHIPFKNVLIENDANAAAYGEYVAGASRGSDSSVMITLGTGVGGGIIIDGKVYSGFNFAAGELGHIVIEYDGVPCTCGRRGCWESYSSATALVRMTKEKINKCERDARFTIMSPNPDDTQSRITARTAFDAMRKGDSAAAEVVEMYINYLACGLANIINIFQPKILCIGGGICNEGEHLMNPLLPIVEQEQYSSTATAKTLIKIAELGNDAGIIGAASLYRQYG